MNPHLLIFPMFTMVLLTVLVLATLFYSRVTAVKRGHVSPKHYKTYQGGATEPESCIKLARHFINMFEAPTLFYPVCLAAMVLGEPVPSAFHALAWLYVLTRALHAYIHTGRNKLRPRILVYFCSWIVLLCLYGLCLQFAWEVQLLLELINFVFWKPNTQQPLPSFQP